MTAVAPPRAAAPPLTAAAPPRAARMARWDLLEQHLVEGSFAWPQFEAALRAPDKTIDDVADGEEERLLAHVDGLILGGPAVAEALLLPALKGEDGPTAAVAAFTLAADPSGLDAVLARWPDAAPPVAQALERALALSPNVQVGQRLRRELASGAGRIEEAILSVLAFRREPPDTAMRAASARLLDDDGPDARALGWRLVDAWRAGTDSRRLRGALASARPVQVAALRVGLAGGAPEAWNLCRAVARRTGIVGELARVALGVGASNANVAALAAAAREPGTVGVEALAALQHAGTEAAVDAALTRAHEAGDDAGPALAVARAITGAPAKATSTPPAFRTWWERQRRKLGDGTRFIRGERLTATEVRRALVTDSMARRRTWALELAVRTAGACTFEPAALTARQRRELADLSALERVTFERPIPL